MEIITCDQFKLTEELREEIITKIDQIKRHMSGPALFKVNLHKKGNSHFSVGLTVSYKRERYRSEASGFNFLKVFNESKAKLIRQVRDTHTKKRSKRHQKWSYEEGVA